tara:strand:+ start:1098 stop:1685 length:588 start_codon:yes stop_codon:yes gene_type:complete
MKRELKIQLILVSIGLLLIFLTYFFYPKINQNKLSEDQAVTKDFDDAASADKTTTFETLEYKGLYNFDKPFTVKSEKAYILNEEPDIVYMDSMHVALYLNDGRVVNITSDKGRYNKITYDCFFEQNVKATDENTIILAENLDLVATKNFVEIYNDVELEYNTNYLQADKINYNFETKYFRVSMFDDKSIKMKVVQ